MYLSLSQFESGKSPVSQLQERRFRASLPKRRPIGQPIPCRLHQAKPSTPASAKTHGGKAAFQLTPQKGKRPETLLPEPLRGQNEVVLWILIGVCRLRTPLLIHRTKERVQVPPAGGISGATGLRAIKTLTPTGTDLTHAFLFLYPFSR